MKLVRQFEQRLDGLLDGLAGRVFSGPLHPTELATRLIRTADLSLTDDLIAHNRFRMVIPDTGEGGVPKDLIDSLEQLIDEAALERGWRLEGPAHVTVSIDSDLRKGAVYMTSDRAPGPRRPWAILSNQQERIPITVNRSTIGRDAGCDVVIAHDQISRRHCSIWTSNEQMWIKDLDSSNGTRVDGESISGTPRSFASGAVIRLADISYRFELV